MTGKYTYVFKDGTEIENYIDLDGNFSSRILSSAENILTLRGGLVSISFDMVENEEYHRAIGYNPIPGLIDDFLIALA